jgi:hypothetical protein
MAGPYYAEGKYVCRVTGQELSTTSNDNLQFVLTFTVLGVPDPENPDNFLKAERQSERHWYQVLNENTLKFALEALERIGFVNKTFSRLDPKTPGFHNFRDQVVDMYCKHEAQEGKPARERWSPARPPAKAPAAVKAEKLEELDRLLAKHQGGGKGAAA